MKMLYEPKRLRAGPNVEIEFAIFLTTVLVNTSFSITKSASVEPSSETIQRARYGNDFDFSILKKDSNYRPCSLGPSVRHSSCMLVTPLAGHNCQNTNKYKS